MKRFKRTPSKPYTLITPKSSLAELEEFLKTNTFALGTLEWPFRRGACLRYISVTEDNRKFVLAVATSQDLEKFRISVQGF